MGYLNTSVGSVVTGQKNILCPRHGSNLKGTMVLTVDVILKLIANSVLRLMNAQIVHLKSAVAGQVRSRTSRIKVQNVERQCIFG
jgi:hypothetical protein